MQSDEFRVQTLDLSNDLIPPNGGEAVKVLEERAHVGRDQERRGRR